VGTPLVRLVVSAMLAAGLAGVVTGCSAGQDTQTDKIVPAVPGANAETPDRNVLLRDVLVAYQPNGYPAGGTAPLSVHIVNTLFDRPVKLTGVKSTKGTVALVGTGSPVTGANASASPSASATGSPSATAAASASRTAGPTGSARPSGPASPSASSSPSATGAFSDVSVPANGYARLTPDSGGQYLAITLSEPLRPGESVNFTFQFDNNDNQSVTVEVPMGLPTVAPTRSPIELPSGTEAR
jgi:hypothetical protein